MDRFVAHCVATAVITAIAAVPTVLAQPSGAAALSAGPAAGNVRTVPSITILPAATVQTTAVQSAAVQTGTIQTGTTQTGTTQTGTTPAPGKGAVCADAYQVGQTVYAHWHGEVIFSVKQYYSPSCHARYSYAFPWLQFRNQHVSYDVGLAVFDVTQDSLDGGTTYVNGIGSPNYWSAPVAVPAGDCTEATVHLFLPDDETDAYTQKFCL
jgi:hypothetical protein